MDFFQQVGNAYESGDTHGKIALKALHGLPVRKLYDQVFSAT